MPDEKKKGFDISAVLGAVPNLGTDSEGREQLKYITLGLIHPDPDNFYSLDGLEELAGNIELIGLQQPLRVRPDPGHEGEYIIVSGHRRRAAIELLVSEGKEDFARVPCLLESRQESEAMRKLRLILANSSTRRLTSAELSKQAEKVERLLYQLQDEGTEFPGRMRDHVADVCQTTKSKLARLKVIRDNLDGEMLEQWEADKISESEAYNLAKLPPEHRAMIWAHKGQHSWGYAGAQAVEVFGKRLGRVDAAEIPAGCPYDKCDNLAGRREASFQGGIYFDVPCEHCCLECPKLVNCKYACPHLSKEINAQKEQAAAAKKADKEMAAEREKIRKEKEKKQRSFALNCWKRLGKALELSGKSALWLAEGLDWHQSEVEDISPLLERGEITDENEYWADECPLDNASFMDIVSLADDLGCSVDYLLCRTDEPGMAKAAPAPTSTPDEPVWLTGSPKRDGKYYCRIQMENGKTLSLALCWDRSDSRWVHPSDGDPVPYPVVGWWPLPGEGDEDE